MDETETRNKHFWTERKIETVGLPTVSEASSIKDRSLKFIACVPLYNESIASVSRLLFSIVSGSAYKNEKGVAFIVNNAPTIPDEVLEENKAMLRFLLSVINRSIDVYAKPNGFSNEDWMIFRALVRGGIPVSVINASTGRYAYDKNNVGYARDRVTKNALRYLSTDDDIIASTDGDCKFTEGYLVKTLEYFYTHPDVDVLPPNIIGDFFEVPPDVAKASLLTSYKYRPVRTYKFNTDTHPMIGGGFTFMRARAFKKTNGYPHVIAGEDSALEHALRISGAQFQKQPEEIKGGVLAQVRLSDRTNPERSFSSETRRVLSGIREHESVLSINAINMILEAGDLYWSTHMRGTNKNPEAFKRRFSTFLKRMRLHEKEIHKLFATIFDTSALGFDGRAYPTLSGNRFFYSELCRTLQSNAYIATNPSITQKNIETLYKTKDVQIEKLLQGTLEKLRKSKWTTAQREVFAPQEMIGQPSVPYNSQTFMNAVKHISKHPVRKEVAHYAIQNLYNDVVRACSNAMTVTALSMNLYKVGQRALSRYFDLCSVSEENSTIAQEYSQLADKLHEGKYQLRSPFHII